MGFLTDNAYSNPLELTTSAAKNNVGALRRLQWWSLLPSDVDTSIQYLRWNKLYPYALVIAEEWFAGYYLEKAKFILPIPPEQLNIQTPYAIQVSKTLGGVVEEHNADPFKIISFTGTTGVNPLRANSTTRISSSIFGGVVQAAQATASSAMAFVGLGSEEVENDETRGTGYGQFRLLEIFLKAYVRAKRGGNKDIRLLFVPFKQQIAYVCTPVQFTMRREANRALKYRYDIQLKAWKEFPSSRLISFNIEPASILSSTGKFMSWMQNRIDAARTTIANAKNVVRNAQAAINRALDMMREISLVGKEAMGLAKTVLDFPQEVMKDFESALKDFQGNINEGYEDLRSSYQEAMAFLDLGPPPTEDEAQNLWPPPSVVNSYFSQPNNEKAQAFLKSIDPDQLKLPPAVQAKMQAEIDRVTAYTRDDYTKMRDEMQAIMVEIGDSLGVADSNYDDTYQNVHRTVTRTMTQQDWDVLFALNDTLNVLNNLAQQGGKPATTMDYIAGFASKSGTAFQVPQSKYAVPFPYDTSLEQLAQMYLNDPDRWIEIAALNGLREPYVDEVGFTRPLVSNGYNCEIMLDDSTNLTIGQPIWIQSITAFREKRHIVNIRPAGGNLVTLTLDGEPTLDRYKVADNAYVHTFLPDTVNSLQLIFIPSDKTVSDKSELARIPGVDAFDDLLEVGGVDLMLKADGDLAITSDGDCRMAYGLQNLIQRAKVALGTTQGALIRHPEFGLPVKAGMSVSDLDLEDLKVAVSSIFASDPAFEGVSKVSIRLNGPALEIGVNLEVWGQDNPISLNFVVPR